MTVLEAIVNALLATLVALAPFSLERQPACNHPNLGFSGETVRWECPDCERSYPLVDESRNDLTCHGEAPRWKLK
jgi:hypothetical protein